MEDLRERERSAFLIRLFFPFSLVYVCALKQNGFPWTTLNLSRKMPRAKEGGWTRPFSGETTHLLFFPLSFYGLRYSFSFRLGLCSKRKTFPPHNSSPLAHPDYWVRVWVPDFLDQICSKYLWSIIIDHIIIFILSHVLFWNYAGRSRWEWQLNPSALGFSKIKFSLKIFKESPDHLKREREREQKELEIVDRSLISFPY